jgi:hypothetical protein
MADRKVGNWLKGFMFYTKESECPDSFLYWAGLHTLSSAIERRTYVPWAYNRFYPNLYLLFIAPPGARKSTAIRFTKKMLQEIGVPTSSETISREALILQMKERGRDAQALAVTVGEFAHFIQVSGVNMITFLTDIYDSEDNFEYTTLKRGVDHIVAPYLTVLGGIVPEKVEYLDKNFVESGLASRTIFAVENGPRFRKAKPQVTDEMLRVRGELIDDLNHITTISGEFVWTSGAEEYFTKWYEQEHAISEETTEHRFRGWMSRKPTHIIRVSQVLTIAKTDELVLTLETLQAAKRLVDSTQERMFHAFSSFGRNPIAGDLQRIADDIVTSGGISKAELISRFGHNLRKDELDEILQQLMMMGIAKVTLHKSEMWVVPLEKK